MVLSLFWTLKVWVTDFYALWNVVPAHWNWRRYHESWQLVVSMARDISLCLVISLIKTSARRFERSFLWIQRKLISQAKKKMIQLYDVYSNSGKPKEVFFSRTHTHFSRTLSIIGVPEMNATSFLFGRKTDSPNAIPRNSLEGLVPWDIVQ